MLDSTSMYVHSDLQGFSPSGSARINTQYIALEKCRNNAALHLLLLLLFLAFIYFAFEINMYFDFLHSFVVAVFLITMPNQGSHC